ncbi:MAG: hypothetical protein U0587_16435 [Candidatus Binatia bacterium]
MGGTTPVIRSVSTPSYGRVTIEASDGKRYSADLMRFRGVPCFPPDADAWSKVWVDSYSLALVWACRFEVHADQVIGLADRVETIDAAA